MKTSTENGITLLTLVATVIILIILTGVSLNANSGEGGIILKTKNTVNKYEMKQTNEQDKLNALEQQLSK